VDLYQRKTLRWEHRRPPLLAHRRSRLPRPPRVQAWPHAPAARSERAVTIAAVELAHALDALFFDDHEEA